MLGKFLSNIYNPNDSKARMYYGHSFHAFMSGSEEMEKEWRQYLEWVRKNVIGPPKETKKYTSEELSKMGMVGVYSPVKNQED